MKKLLISTVAVVSLFAAPTIKDLQKQIRNLQTQLKQLKTNQGYNTEAINEVTSAHQGDNIKFKYDLRTSLDYLYYKMKNGDVYTNNILSNRVRLTGKARVNSQLIATLQIEANNIFGMNDANNYYDNQNSFASETPDDTNLRVKEAFFNYFFGKNNEYMFSAGRRPAVGGYPANLREGDFPTSPVAHLVNMEFDGFSFWMRPDAMGSYGEDYGTNIKFCFGRGYSSDVGKFTTDGSPAYSKSKLSSNDMGGFLLIPYNDDQYSVWWENIWSWHNQGMIDTNGDGKPDTVKDVGSYFGTNIIFKADGIGDGISDFMDDTKAFVSLAYTTTRPNSNGMLGSTESKMGYSIWMGADMPANEDTNDRFGVSFVAGSKYFRPMTYGEDTLAGSIAAVRGYAVDAYYNKYLLSHLTTNFRFTYLNYNNAGSEAFFGDGGNPDQTNYVDKAMDIRAYIRYQF